MSSLYTQSHMTGPTAVSPLNSQIASAPAPAPILRLNRCRKVATSFIRGLKPVSGSWPPPTFERISLPAQKPDTFLAPQPGSEL